MFAKEQSLWIVGYNWRMKILPFLFSLLVFLPAITQAEETTCDPISLQQQIDQADIIFSGTCIFVNSNWISGGQKFVFEVEQTWKRRTDSIYIVNSKWEQDGGYTFQQGQSYLVYVDKGFTPKTNRCMGNKLLSEATDDLKLLGQGQIPTNSSLVTPMIWTISFLGLFSFAFLGFIIFYKRKKPA